MTSEEPIRVIITPTGTPADTDRLKWATSCPYPCEIELRGGTYYFRAADSEELKP